MSVTIREVRRPSLSYRSLPFLVTLIGGEDGEALPDAGKRR